MTSYNSCDIICDFDGTATPVDTTDLILARFALPQWEEVEAQWTSGQITSRECMCRQIAMLRTDKESLNSLIDEIPLADGFVEFVHFAGQNDLRPHIVSDGIDYVIRRILSKHGLSEIPVTANRLMMTEHGFELEFPHCRPLCGYGLCKCDVAEKSGCRIILIGDGRSDFCLSDRADLVMARRGKPLESHCREQGRPYKTFDDFFDIITIFEDGSVIIPGLDRYSRQHAQRRSPSASPMKNQ
ncbi:MAG: MtnX-like HAD-IB family phosphatase [Deltaproteobacteria bacterium]|jgi:2,3-diketo-5-methylthio-1-phosphopentane phosphatase|nr:MtnX-like HAD-IB family phosphatase [Deltaproteobacteria bacterium]